MKLIEPLLGSSSKGGDKDTTFDHVRVPMQKSCVIETSKMVHQIRRAIAFGDSRGLAIHWEFVCHHNFDEGDPLPFILGGSSDLTPYILKALMKTFEMGKPVRRDLLGNWWVSF
ncbi:UNVERIFIED_CONTAM: hypothetical protein Slati_3103700 [Sesamum latifolium]|uniref:Uncharacterized protein n=1 Tax=Sesamum latifolium TaxID=2727402 RepID=A0AAW2UVB9_9LAMI